MPGIKGTMKEFGEGKLHSGSKKGPEVKSRAQAIAIGLSEERKEGHKVAPKKEYAHGHPGEHLHMKEEGHRVGVSLAAHQHEAESKSEKPGMHGHPGHHAHAGSGTHGFGHAAHQRHGALRMSGMAGAHRIGKK